MASHYINVTTIGPAVRVDHARLAQLRIGMIDHVVLHADLEEATLMLANGIVEATPFVLKLTKRSLNFPVGMSGLRDALTAHFDTYQLSHVLDALQQQRAQACLEGATAPVQAGG